MSPSQRNSIFATVLVIDDNPEDRTAVRHFLSEAGAAEGLSFQIHESGKGEDGLAAWTAQTPDCILLDYHLPDMDGLEFLARLKTEAGKVPLPVVMFTGSSDRSLASASLRAGAQEYLPKRFMGAEMLLRAVQSAQDRFNLHTERSRAEGALAASEELLRLSQEAGQIAAYEQDFAANMIRWANGSQALLGFPPTHATMTVAEYFAARHPEDAVRIDKQRAAALARKAPSISYEYRIYRPDTGALREIEVHLSIEYDATGQPRRSNGAVTDVTERRAAEHSLAQMSGELERRVTERTAELVEATRCRLETETLLHQAQKTEAIGQLTGGIAHDFNNILHIIIGNLEVAQRRLERCPPAVEPEWRNAISGLRRSMDDAQKAANSAAQLVQRLLAFGRRQALAPTQLAVNDLVLGLTKLVRRTLGPTITVETVLAEDVWPTIADANQLEAALLNLVVNARDAMPAGGRVIIETSNVHLDDAYALPLGDVPPGAYVLLSVTDAGTGIPKDLLGRVFEPFFTTKAIGHGTGLGLSMVYGFVKQSGGHVRIYSEIGEGTTVKIYLRRSAAVGQERTPWPTAQTTFPTPCGTETILVVEDDEGVRSYVQDALEDLGYRVLTATDAAAALTVLEADQTSRIDLMFTDVIMPGGVNGLALANQVAERWPNLPLLFTTGYSPGAFIGDDRNGSPVRFLGKPYSIDALARKVREALDAAEEPAARPGHPGGAIS